MHRIFPNKFNLMHTQGHHVSLWIYTVDPLYTIEKRNMRTIEHILLHLHCREYAECCHFPGGMAVL